MNSGGAVSPKLDFFAQTVGGITIAEVTGKLDIASAPALREQLLSLLRPGSSSLVVDLSKVSFADASGLAVLVSTARHARLLGGCLRLAAVSPPTAQVLHITGLDRNLAIFPTVQAAATGPRVPGRPNGRTQWAAARSPLASARPPLANPPPGGRRNPRPACAGS